MSNELLNAALFYAKQGWLVLPIKTGQKAPLTMHGIKDASSNEGTIKAWWSKWPDANIGIACGVASGIHVIDVDVDPAKGIDGWESLKELGSVPETVGQHSPRGGAHFLFKTDKPPRNMNGFRVGIDIRSDKYYIVVAPSVHPNGKQYMWMEGHAPGEIELAEFPDWARPENEKPKLAWQQEQVIKREPVASTPIIERARLYLEECEPACSGFAGHSKLLWACNAMVNGFNLPESTALSLLWDVYNPRCSPPWDRSKPSEVTEFERKVIEARKTCNKPIGWLLDELGYNDVDPEAIKIGSEIADKLLAPKKSEVVERPEILSSKKEPRKPRAHDGWSKELLNPTGYVGELVKWMNATAGCAQPKLAVLCSIVGAGALFGGKIKDEQDGRTNLFAMGVAKSSAGKDHPFKCISRLFNAAGAKALLGGGRFTSDSALEMALSSYGGPNPIQLFGIDEAGDFLTGIKQAGSSGGASHLATIKPALKELWSSANGEFRGKQKAEEIIKRFDNPCVCIWALTTPDRFYQGLAGSDLEDGFVPRMLVCVSEIREPYTYPKAADVPRDLITTTNLWASRAIPVEGDEGDIRTAMKQGCMLVVKTPAAAQMMQDFSNWCTDRMGEDEKRGNKTSPIWGKCAEQAGRVALIMAASDNYDNPIIDIQQASFAIELVKTLTFELISSINKNMSDSPYEADKQKIMKIIASVGGDGMLKRDLTRRTQYFKDKKVRDSYLQDLEESGQIQIKRVGSSITLVAVHQ